MDSENTRLRGNSRSNVWRKIGSRGFDGEGIPFFRFVEGSKVLQSIDNFIPLIYGFLEREERCDEEVLCPIKESGGQAVMLGYRQPLKIGCRRMGKVRSCASPEFSESFFFVVLPVRNLAGAADLW